MKEDINELDWEAQLKMYKISAISPLFVTSALVKAKAFASNAKLVLISSEAGSIRLRTEEEGGGMFGHQCVTRGHSHYMS